MSAVVHLSIEGRIAKIRLEKPEKHNVLDRNGWRALAEVFEKVSAEEDVGCVVLRGAGGGAFSAGSDIAAFAEQRDTPEDVRAYSRAIADALQAIRNCPHPTLAVITGLCVGGGLEIAACCDVRLCEASSRFGAPINRLGLTMSHEELEPLIELIGPAAVLELLLTGELYPSTHARRIGLVSRICSDGQAVARGYEIAEQIATGAPLVNRWHKKFVRRLSDPTPLTPEEVEEAHEAFDTRDYREGRDAFLEKRQPRFQGE